MQREGRRALGAADAYQPYEKGNIFNKDPIRPRRLLMHKREIQRLASKVQLDATPSFRSPFI